jgi:hypothetical protein
MPVSNPRDEIDAWLDSDVEPLTPPPGSFERIRKRARRRKSTRAIVSVAGAVVVIAAIAALPRVASALLPGSTRPAGQNIAAGQSRPATSASPAGAASSPPTLRASSPAPGPPFSATPAGRPAARRFRPTSITLISTSDGAVLGQASCARAAGSTCTSLAGTADYGASWYAVGAPRTGAPSGSAGVSQLRFLHFDDGWAFGPGLYATTDNGSTWTAESTSGYRVTDLETAGERAFALFASCTGSGSGYAASCTSFSLYSSAAGSTTWQPVAVPRAYRSMTGSVAGQPASASIVLASGTIANPDAGTGYVLAPSGELLSGPLTGGPWTAVGHIPNSCQVGSAQPDGQPAGVQLATGPAAQPQLMLSCDEPASTDGAQAKAVYTSSNGTAWQRVGTAPRAGTASSLAAASGGLAVLATSAGIDYSANDGISWQAAGVSSAPSGGFAYIGMTDSSQGVAVPVNSRLGEVFTTADGGQDWTPAPVK